MGGLPALVETGIIEAARLTVGKAAKCSPCGSGRVWNPDRLRYEMIFTDSDTIAEEQWPNARRFAEEPET